MKKLLLILLISLLLTSCYSAKDDCYHGMTVICNGEEFSKVARFQKPYSLGKTDTEQRWKDLVSCGVKRGDITLQSAWIVDMSNNGLSDKLLNKFLTCMNKKGYIRIPPSGCGRKNSTTDKGICNE